MPNSDPVDLIDGLATTDDVSKPEMRAEMKAVLRRFESASEVGNTSLSGRFAIVVNGLIYLKDTESTDAPDGTSIIVDGDGINWRAGLQGNTDIVMADSLAAAELVSVPSTLSKIFIAGYRTPGDWGPPVQYIRVDSEPAHDLKVQIGALWFEFAGDTLYPEHAGGYNDDTNTGSGVHSDSAAFQSCIDYLRTLTNGGELALRKGSGYRLTTALDCYPSVPLSIRGEPGSTVYVDNTTVSDVMFKITHPTDPTIRAPGQFTFRGRNTIQVRSNVIGSVGPCLVEARRASDLSIEGNLKLVHYANNTALRCSDLWNARWMGNVEVWGAGHRKPYKVATGTFSMSSGDTTITSSASEFSADDEGHTIVLVSSSGVVQQFTLETGSSSSFTTTETAVANFTAASGLFDHTKGTLTAASQDIVLEVAPVATDVGRYIVVPNAVELTSPVRSPFRAKVTAANVGTKTITVDAAAPNDFTGYVIFSPSVELFGEGRTSADLTNDFTIASLHIEQPKGLPLFIGGQDDTIVSAGTTIIFDWLKLHAQNNQFGAAATDGLAVINASSVHIKAIDAEGTPVGSLGQLHIEGCSSGVTIDKWGGANFPGMKAIDLQNNYKASVFQIGPRLHYAPNFTTQALYDANWAAPAAGSGRLFILGAGGSNPNFGFGTPLDSGLQIGGDRLRKVGDATDDEDALNRQSGDARFGKPFGTSRLTSRWYPAVAGAYEKSVAVATLDTVLYAYPFKIDRPTTIKSFYTRVVTGAAGSAVKLGIWAHDDATERPTSTAITGLVSNTGQATTTNGAAGLGSLDKLLAPGWYWFGCAFTTLAPTMSSLSGSLPGQNPIEALIGRSAIAGANIVCALSTPFTYSSDIATLDLTGVTWTDVAGDAGVPVMFYGT